MIAVFVVMLFLPVTVSASDYTVINIDDYIYVRVGDDWNPVDFQEERFYEFHTTWFSWECSPLQAFLGVVLCSAGYEFDSSTYFTEKYMDSWEKNIMALATKQGCLGVVDAINKLMTECVYSYQDTKWDYEYVPVVGFSASFASIFNSWVALYFSLNEIEPTLNFDIDYVNVNMDEWFAVDNSSYVFYYDISFTHTVKNDIHPAQFVLKSRFSYDNDFSYELRDVWDEIISSINIQLYTSWLPDKISAPIVFYFGMFLSVCLVLIAIKVFHG